MESILLFLFEDANLGILNCISYHSVIVRSINILMFLRESY